VMVGCPVSRDNVSLTLFSPSSPSVLKMIGVCPVLCQLCPKVLLYANKIKSIKNFANCVKVSLIV